MPCLFGSDSHTIYWIRYVIYRFHGRSRKKTHIAIRLFADELELERGVRRQIHRRSPHRIIYWIQWYLCPWLSVAFLSEYDGAHTALDGSQEPSCGALPTTKMFYRANK